MSPYESALVELYRAPYAEFVAERKRLVGQLAASGEKARASRLAKITRPSISAWAVNQLYWQARPEFDEFLESAARVRRGDLEATGAHRKASTKLVSRAASFLTDAGHSANEATLRRVTATLAALAAAGGFEPNLPGTLSSDRDPPGFDAVGIEALPVKPRTEAGKAAATDDTERSRALALAEKRKAEEEQARAKAERRRLEGLLRTAQAEVSKLTLERDERKRELEAAEARLERAGEAVTDFEIALTESRTRISATSAPTSAGGSSSSRVGRAHS